MVVYFCVRAIYFGSFYNFSIGYLKLATVWYFFLFYILFESGNLTEIPLTDEYDNASSSILQKISADTSYLLGLMLWRNYLHLTLWRTFLHLTLWRTFCSFCVMRTFLYLTLWRNFYIFISYGEHFYILRYGENFHILHYGENYYKF